MTPVLHRGARAKAAVWALLASVCAIETTKAQDSTRAYGRVRGASDPMPTGRERVDILMHRSVTSSSAWIRTVLPAIGSQVGNRPEEWGRTPEGFLRRVGSQAARVTTRDVVQATGAALLHHDPRYQRCDCAGGFRRLGHALSGTVMLADRNGQRRLDPSNVLASFGTGYVSARLSPHDTRLSVRGYQRGNQLLAQSAFGNVVIEFAPDVRRIVRQTIRGRR
jgi:hypothetical protein